MVHTTDLIFNTEGRQTREVTHDIQRTIGDSSIQNGLCCVFLHHTSASLILSENPDPTVRRDLEAFLSRLVPDGDRIFEHTAEGPDDMPAHVRSVLTQNSITLPVRNGACDLGTWQGLYLWEHRHRGHRRRISVTLMGE